MSKIFRSLFLAITLTLLFSANALAGPVLDRIVKTGELTISI